MTVNGFWERIERNLLRGVSNLLLLTAVLICDILESVPAMDSLLERFGV
jgi:hypothetical protein